MPATPEFFSAVRELCDETGALMIVDEVQVKKQNERKITCCAWRKRFDTPPSLNVFRAASCLRLGCPAAERVGAGWLRVHTTLWNAGCACRGGGRVFFSCSSLPC